MRHALDAVLEEGGLVELVWVDGVHGLRLLPDRGDVDGVLPEIGGQGVLRVEGFPDAGLIVSERNEWLGVRMVEAPLEDLHLPAPVVQVIDDLLLVPVARLKLYLIGIDATRKPSTAGNRRLPLLLVALLHRAFTGSVELAEPKRVLLEALPDDLMLLAVGRDHLRVLVHVFGDAEDVVA